MSAGLDILRGLAAVATFGSSEWLLSQAGIAPLWAPLLPGPDAPAAGRNTGSGSPNNDPFNRQNQGRPFSRIPDLFGTNLAIPDLLTAPYKRFVGNSEVEHSLTCVGRGSYSISRIRDGSTPIEQLPAVSLQVWGPNTSPNSGAAQLSYGPANDETFYGAKRFGGVDGQTLMPPNVRIIGDENSANPDDGWGNIRFRLPNLVEAKPDSGVSFASLFSPGDSVVIDADAMNATITGRVSIDGMYTVDTVDDTWMTLVDPVSINGNWSSLPTDPDDHEYSTNRATLTCTRSDRWVGPFFCNMIDAEHVLANVVASAGIYKVAGAGDNAGKQYSSFVAMEIAIAPSTDGVAPSGSWATYSATLRGAATDKMQRGKSLQEGATGPCLVRMRRTTAADYDYVGTVVDEVKWRELYQLTPITQDHFGDVTTIRMAMPRTRAAVYERERKLNCLATRKVGAGLVATNRADEILLHAAADPFIGRGHAVDAAGIRDAVSRVVSYFGTPLAGEFNGTLDKDGMSFEETATALAAAVHCTVHRQGSVLQLKPELKNPTPTLLFNHRNIVPGTQIRIFTCGNRGKYDGVELRFVDAANNDELSTIYVPAEGAANPQKIETTGIRNRLQAYLLAWRAWNKIRYQSESVEQEVLEEATILVQNDCVLIADTTRTDFHQGDVLGVDDLTLTLSQPQSIAEASTIFLQLPDGSVDSMAVTAGGDSYSAAIARAPRLPLVVGAEQKNVAKYWITADASTRERAFLVTEKEPAGEMTMKLSAVSYSDSYYANDRDYRDGVVDVNGYPL